MCTEDNINRQYILDVKNLDKNLMIEAGAGSGKTTILIDRLIMQIKETDIKLSELVAITFTEKAADVLKFRFQNELVEAHKNESDPIKKRRLTEALNNVETIQISTIHSFCNKILNECPFEANLGPGFGILRTQEEANAKNRFIKAYAKKHENDENMLLIKTLGLNPLNFTKFFSDLIDEEYSEIEYSTSYNTHKEYYDNAISKAQLVCDEIKAAWDATGLSYDRLIKASKGDKPHINDGLIKAYEASMSSNSKNLRIAIEKLSGYIGEDNDGYDILRIKGSVTKKELPEFYKIVKELESKLGQHKTNIREVMYCLNDLYLSMLEPMAEAYKTEAKRNLSNQELLNYTCNLLRNSSKAREYLRNNYKFFYVDEYQDTDPVQTEIFLWLVASKDLVGNNLTEKIKNATLLPGKICYIGDPKQSIYGFRKADITLYTKVKELIIKDANSELVNLYANFRSNKEICSWVENTFKNDFPGLKIETNKQLCDDKDALSGVYYYRYKYSNSTNDDIAYEAEHIAKLIKGLIDSKCKLYSADRPVEEKDFMVLTPVKKQITVVVNALKKYGLKVEVDGESTISNSKEVTNLLYILDYVNDPKNALKFGKLIRYVAREHCIPGEDYTEAIKLILEQDDIEFENQLNALQLSEKVAKLVKKLRRLVSRRYTPMPLVLVQQVIEDLGSLVYSGNYDDDKVGYVYGQLEQVFEQLRNKPIATLNCVCRELKNIVDNKELDKELMVRNASNSVRVMNVHKSKGLEGKVVILAAGRYSNQKHISSNLYCIESTNGNRIVSEPKESSNNFQFIHSYSKGYDVADKGKGEAEKEEHIRLLYVAATRAEEALIIPIPYGVLSDSEAKTGNKKFVEGKEFGTGFWGALKPKYGEDDRVHNPYEAEKLLEERFAQNPGAKADIKARIRKQVYEIYCNTLNENCKKYGKPSEIIQEPKVISNKSDINSVNDKLIYRDDSVYGTIQEKNLEILGANQLGDISEKLVSPSSMEEHNHHNNGDVEAGRMKGNLYGLILHKTYELVVKKIMLNRHNGIEYIKENQDEIIEYILPLAVGDGLEQEPLTVKQCNRILIPEEVVDELLKKTLTQQIKYLVNHFRGELSGRIKDFLDDKEIMEDLLGEPDTVSYTELPFAMYMPNENGVKTFVNGTMDLLIETKDKFIIWDYKSDGRQYLPNSKELENIEDFEMALDKVYAPQLELYTKAVEQMIANDDKRKGKRIVTKLYHMYRGQK